VKRLATPLLAAAIFLLNVWLNAPLFMAGDLPFPGSIERGYVGMARFVSQHPNPWGWNPYPYCGLPTQFMYVPGLPYLSAFFMRLLPQVAPDMVYRTIVSLITCLGPVTLFFFALYFTGSRKWSFAAAVGYSFLSPSYALFPAVEKDRGIAQLPWRIQVLAKYGEGPHNTGLTLLPLALLALFRAAKGRGYPRILGAAVLLAAIPLCNWVGAFALAMSSMILLVAAWGEPEFQYWRAFAAAGLAYLLACFWLTPSFIKTIAFNWPVDSFAYHLKREQVWLLAGMIGGALVIRLCFRLWRGSFYFCGVTMGAFVFGWVATAFYVYGLDTIPESRRYAIEFELFTALALAEALRLSLRSPNSTVKMCAWGAGGVMLLVGSPQLFAYVSQGYSWRPSPPEQTLEYRLGQWMAQHPPEGRVFASGGMRFRLNSFFDLQQVGGGFETGLQNRVPYDLSYDIRAGHDAGQALLELKALGTQYVVIHGPKSKEYYRDFQRLERVSANLPAVYHIEDDTIYALPARPLAHFVTEQELSSLPAYVAAIEDPARPALQTAWRDAGALDITGPSVAGQVVSVQVNADPGWRATQDGRDLAMESDRLGFIVLKPAPAAATHLELHYHGTLEQRLMAVLCALTWVCALGALVRKKRLDRIHA
jgi:hypothetical protein